MSELFPAEAVEMLSPKLAWRKRHGVQTLHSEHCEEAAWIAWLDADCDEPGGIPRDPEACGYGDTEEEAMADLGLKRGLKLWNEEGGA